MKCDRENNLEKLENERGLERNIVKEKIENEREERIEREREKERERERGRKWVWRRYFLFVVH